MPNNKVPKETVIEQIIRDYDAKKPLKKHAPSRKVFDSIMESDASLLEDLFNEIEEGHNPFIEDPQLEEWEYFSIPQLDNFDFYKEKAKFIFKKQLSYREFLEKYKQTNRMPKRKNKGVGVIKELEKMSVQEFQTLLADIRFLDRVEGQLAEWYGFMYMLYTCGISYTQIAEMMGRNKGYKGSIENEVKKGIDAFAKLLMERDINTIRGEEIAKKALEFEALEQELSPSEYLEFIGSLAMKMHKMYLELDKKR